MSLAQRTTAQEALASVLAASLTHHGAPSLEGVVADPEAWPQSRASPHPLQQKGVSLLALSKELLGSYDTLSRDMARYEEMLQVGRHWEGDYQKLQHLLQVGKQVTEDRVGAMLVDGSQDVGQGGVRDGVLEQDRRKWEDLSGVRGEDDGGETWTVAARKVERGVRRLVRCLPEE